MVLVFVSVNDGLRDRSGAWPAAAPSFFVGFMNLNHGGGPAKNYHLETQLAKPL